MRVDELQRESLVMRRFPPPWIIGEEAQPIERRERIWSLIAKSLHLARNCQKKIPDVRAATTAPAPIRSSESKTHCMFFTWQAHAQRETEGLMKP
jgi:hypothetical protein